MSMPMPASSTPALLLMIVSPRVPRANKALMRFSGIPQRPKPPIMIVAPSGMTATASAGPGTTLFPAYRTTIGGRGQRVEGGAELTPGRALRKKRSAAALLLDLLRAVLSLLAALLAVLAPD